MQIEGSTPINLTLNVDTVNIILGSLSNQPYERVAGLITEIQRQAVPQIPLAEQQAANTEEEAA